MTTETTSTRTGTTTSTRTGTTTSTTTGTASGAAGVASWPLLLLAAPAFVAIWSGWVGLGGLTGFGLVHPLPGIADAWTLNTAITLPVGVETYAAYALRVWLSGNVPARARAFARASALGSLVLGAAGQVAYHLMSAAKVTAAPWPITAAVACLPVAVLGMGAALAHLVHTDQRDDQRDGQGDDQEDERGRDGAPPVAPVGPVAVDVAPVERPARVRRVERASRPAGGAGGGTAARVARARAAHPEWTARQIAARLGVTDRTVRRHLAALDGPDAPGEDGRAA